MGRDMRVFTYYQPVPELLEITQRFLVECWKDSWAGRGWNPIVLTEADARRHPLFMQYSVAVASYPTVNARGYENACWLRWLAYAVAAQEHAGAIVATDYDVINRDWIARDIGSGREPRLVAFAETPTAACMGHRRNFDAFIVDVIRQAERGIVRKNGRMHVSDMTLAQAVPERWDWSIICEEWRRGSTAPLLHVSQYAVDAVGTSKADVMRSWRSPSE